MNNPRQELAELAAVLATEATNPGAPHLIACDAIALTRVARRAQSLAVNQCNFPMDEELVAKRRASIRKAAAVILKNYGAERFEVSGDPRGCVFQVELPSKRSNSWGGLWAVVA